MYKLKQSRIFTLIEPGPVILVTDDLRRKQERRHDHLVDWTMVLDFTPVFAIATGAWNYSSAALQRPGSA
jgi:hypothetical protein